MQGVASAEPLPGGRRWNWGAFLLGWLWGLGNRTPIALLAAIPVLGFIVAVVLGIKGNDWAWQNGVWRDVRQFQAVQRRWAIAGFALWGFAVVGGLVMIFWLAGVLRWSEPHRLAMAIIGESPAVREKLGSEVAAGPRVVGSIQWTGIGTGTAELAIPLRGSRAAATALVWATKDAGVWKLDRLVVQVEATGEVIELVPDGAAPVSAQDAAEAPPYRRIRPAMSLMTAHASRTWRRSVQVAPIATRMV